MKKRSLPIGAALRQGQNKKTKSISTSVSELEDKIAQLERELNSSSSESTSTSGSDEESEDSDREDEGEENSSKEFIEVVDEHGNVVAIQSRLVGQLFPLFYLFLIIEQKKKLPHFRQLTFLILIVVLHAQNKNGGRRKSHSLPRSQSVDLKKVSEKCYKTTNQPPQNEDHFGVVFVLFKHKMNRNSISIARVKSIKLPTNTKENSARANYAGKNSLHQSN
jgi:hypothetical protein